MKWISIKEEEPLNNQRVLICDEFYQIFTAYFHLPEKEFMIDSGSYCETEYWMPIPCPPSEEKCKSPCYRCNTR